MARAPATADPFTAVAEPRRRQILEYLAPREQSVGAIVAALDLPQPSVSKHLRVLHDVGLVDARRQGRQMLYRTNADVLKSIHDWTNFFERYWRRQLLRIKDRAENTDVEKE